MALKTPPPTDEYRKGWDAIFGKKTTYHITADALSPEGVSIWVENVPTPANDEEKPDERAPS